jgi:hypothetical protein
MLEKLIESHLRRKIKNVGGVALKFTSPNYDGMPDRIVLLPNGRIYFVELKVAGKKATPKQLKVHGMLRKLGFNVLVLDNKLAVDEFVNGVKI